MIVISSWLSPLDLGLFVSRIQIAPLLLTNGLSKTFGGLLNLAVQSQLGCSASKNDARIILVIDLIYLVTMSLHVKASSNSGIKFIQK